MSEKKIFFKKLVNGLSVIVYPIKTIPKVMTQMWYNVGSKHEKTKEKGLAHLLEHMVFKGTENLSESDINEITHKLSGYCNAFTSYDYTGYLFNFPSQNWQQSLSILSDCMTSCRFDSEMLNSELKAVVQELKMYNDNYGSTLAEKMVTAMFPGHPYQNPIIGYKHDLFEISSEDLKKFYKKYYAPNNASLIIVGDVDPDVAFQESEKHFSSIPEVEIKKESFYVPTDLEAIDLKIYRDIKVPLVLGAFRIPACNTKNIYYNDLLCWILANGRGSRLYSLLVDSGLASTVHASFYDMFDGGVFFIQVQPVGNDIDSIKKIIHQAIYNLINGGISKEELVRATKLVRSNYMDVFESLDDLASSIGRLYLVTGDPEAFFKTYNTHHDNLRDNIINYAKEYFHPSLMSFGSVLPLEKGSLTKWKNQQEYMDTQDQVILSRKEREKEVEEACAAKKIEPIKDYSFNFPEYKESTLDNGLEVLSHKRSISSKVEIILDLPLKHDSDPEGLQGLANITAEMLLEGTEKFSQKELSQEIENRGMAIKSSAGYIAISCLKEDLPVAIEILQDILTKPKFEIASLEKIRNRVLNQLDAYWDNPVQFIDQIVRENIYKNHPYRKNLLGNKESVSIINIEDVINYWSKCYSPTGSRLAIVGDLPKNYLEIISDFMGKWTSKDYSLPVYPKVSTTCEEEILYKINRDQVVLELASSSVSRSNPDYDKIMLFDQIFTGGSLGSMSSMLFQLREQTGLFYSISGSLLAGSGKQAGMIAIKTILSVDRVKEGQEAIFSLINQGASLMTEENLTEAKDSIINSLPDYFESNEQTASAFLYLKRQGLPKDFFKTRAKQINKINLQEVREAVGNLLKDKKFITVKVGRV